MRKNDWIPVLVIAVWENEKKGVISVYFNNDEYLPIKKNTKRRHAQKLQVKH